MITYTINLEPLGKMTDEQFYQLCRKNPEINFERNAKGELMIMPPTGGETGNRNSEINAEFVFWNRQTKLGKVFDSNTCFKFPNGAERSPDVSWIKLERWNQLTLEQKEKFPPIAPDFVLELMSPSDSVKNTQEKMAEYQANGVKLGWLINRKDQQVEIYRQGKSKEVLNEPIFLSGEDILPEFVLDLAMVW
ncbi:unknown [Crocosphaera subtropica ATCC 51142]|uniref:Putative restriction endonuclease domain-containing protein n=1 Tax=Crocosphaera subtropica (strain ATCC 51142 / BH68) TaxID=43989 RepID=B1WTD0_CROS5|nr:Uma2 family endonuclease [Crocosphaera subtropica]ACB52052.1 unknown [Crocosphaera subtropica ATCC 51142]